MCNVRIALYPRHVGAGCEGLCDLAGAFHQDRVNDVERTMLEPAFTQPSQNRALRCLDSYSARYYKRSGPFQSLSASWQPR